MSWIRVLDSAEVAAGEIRAVDRGDDELVVWRTADGRAVVCDARCPHQWSHLEAEGFVDGDELVCSAHFWRFDVHGHGTKLNDVNGRRDEKSDVQVHPCREVDGGIEIADPSAGDASPNAGGPIVDARSAPAGSADDAPT